MSKFEVGQRVKIYPYGGTTGHYGEIEAGTMGIVVDVDERSVYPYKVFVEGREDTTTILLQDREMQLAPAPDAPTPAVDDMPDYVRAVVPPDMPVVKVGNVWVSAPPPDVADGGDDAASIFVGIERRIMKSGDTRYLEGINEPIGLETAKYINNQSMALHDANQARLVFAGQADDLRAQIATLQAQLTVYAGQVAQLTDELAVAAERERTLRALIDAIEDHLPPDRTHIGNETASAAVAWNAAIAMDLIRAYKAQDSAS